MNNIFIMHQSQQVMSIVMKNIVFLNLLDGIILICYDHPMDIANKT